MPACPECRKQRARLTPMGVCAACYRRSWRARTGERMWSIGEIAPEVAAVVSRAAGADGVSVGTWVRRVICEAAGISPISRQSVRRHIGTMPRRIGTTLLPPELEAVETIAAAYRLPSRVWGTTTLLRAAEAGDPVMCTAHRPPHLDPHVDGAARQVVICRECGLPQLVSEARS